MKHTKGPWDYHVNGKETHVEFAIVADNPREDGTRGICSVMDYNRRSEEDRANAILIAAAPELLGALIEAHEWAKSDKSPMDYPFDKVKAAIKSATE